MRLSKILSRRDMLTLSRATITALFVGGCTSKKSSFAQTSTNKTTLPTCIVSPQQTEGPYFVDEKLNRSDIRTDPTDGKVSEGAPLQLTLRVSGVGNDSCTPIAGAIVDIWHCDALGVYSDVTDRSFDTVGKKFLRGYQVTDNNGTVRFTTIYPGWYQGRTVHIHFKVRTAEVSSRQSYEFTSQLYFDDAVSDRVYKQMPYTSKGKRNQTNEQDGIFQGGGDNLMLSVTENQQGVAATFNIGLQIA
ncbi:MAG: intradiol ring-cleavage dioxygenase [Chroococcus sp. CMT-3BRIN-NPC107]|nr:intradiol ring-cleavage dioxygenase [Chroococcus sp. CMT-3BRIN-NPC107]